MKLLDPVTGGELREHNSYTLVFKEGQKWPVLDGIPFLRLNREALIGDIFKALDAGDEQSALVLALRDRDDHAKGPLPDEDKLQRLAKGEVETLREAMQALNYGPVAHYFAHRWSAPTFLSGLSLLADYWRPGLTLVEVACGLGQLLREAAIAGAMAIGVDVVFSKLWLAKRYVLGADVELICADVQHGIPIRLDEPSAVLCHDALYFLEEKTKLIGEMKRLAGEDGAVLVGHAHNLLFDQRGISGWPLTPEQWADLLPGAALYDDRVAADSWMEGELATPAEPSNLQSAEAISMALGERNLKAQSIGLVNQSALRLNPLLRDDGDGGHLTPNWPTTSLANEYQNADYLNGEAMPSTEIIEAVSRGKITPEIERLLRRRVLLNLPEAW